MGTSEAHVSISLVNKNNHIVVEVYVSDNKDLFDNLFKHKDKIEQELGFKLIWDRLNNKK